jgi:dihydrolipoamide dehydrogenase
MNISKTIDIKTELVVIGSGPGGYTAAFRAADVGLNTVLVEKHPTLGGVCLNVGCIPSKTLLHTAQVVQEAKHLGTIGIDFGSPTIDLGRLRAWKNKVIDQLTGGLSILAKKRTVKTVQGLAHFSSDHHITVNCPDKDLTIEFDHAIIATGSNAKTIPGMPSDRRIMDSTIALELINIPDRLLIIGGGVIGLEMACIYLALGSRITIVESLGQLMPETDADLVRPLLARLKHQCEAIYLNTKVNKIDPQAKHITVSFEGVKAPQSANFDKILVAIGRFPDPTLLQIQNAGITSDSNGFIPVDNQQRTNVPHIFAIGDIVGSPMLAHKASHEGRIAAEVIAGRNIAFHAQVIPSVAYTDPEIAWVGLTENMAKNKSISYEKSMFPWAASGRALGIGRSEGLTKLLFDPKTKRILGAGIVGVNAGDLIAETCLAIEMGCESEDISLTIHPHPTLSETIAFSADVYQGTITDLYMPGKK